MEGKNPTSGKKHGILQMLPSVPIEEIIEDCLTKYKINKKLGILDIVQLLFDAAGHNSTLTIEVIEEHNPKDIIEHLRATIPATKELPVQRKEIYVKVVVFFQKLIFNCDSLLFDDFLLATFFKFVVHMSCSSLRAFRYVGTLVGLKAITALVGVHQAYNKRSLDFEERLYGGKGKDVNFESSDRFNQLQEKYFKHKRNEEELTQLLNGYLLKHLFQERILDTMSEIQIMCLDEAVQWMQICPQIFVVERYLKFYALLVFSPSVQVRRTILKSLLYLFKTQTLDYNLEVFVSKHIVDIVNLTLDKSLLVSVEALSLLTEILKAYGPEILKGHKKSIFWLVLCKHKNVATAAADFLLTWLKMKHEPKHENPSNIWILIHLSNFLAQVKRPKHAPYLVEILTTNCSALQDWQAMSYILITQTENMTTEQETCFMNIMSAAISQSCSKKIRDEHNLKITQCFTEHFPKLLCRYKEDAEKISSLLQIGMCLQLEEMPSKDKNVNEIVKTLKYLVNINSDLKVIEGCCEVIEYFISQQPKKEKQVCLKRWSIADNVFKKFIKIADKIQGSHDISLTNDDHIFTLASTLEKLVIMYEYKDQEGDKLWDFCLYFISHPQECVQLPKTFIVLCIKMCHKIILSAKVQMEKQPRADNDEIFLQRKLLQLLVVLEQFLTDEVREFRKSAFFVICDMLLIFCENGAIHYPKLGITADDSLQLLLRKYVEELVFLRNYELNDVNLEFGTSVLNAYCKLLSYGMLKIEAGIWIFWYFKKKEKDYAAILKKTIANMLKSDFHRTGIYLMNMLFHSLEVYVKKEKRADNPDSVRKFIHEKITNFFYLLSSNSEAKFYFHKKALFHVCSKDTSSRDKSIILEILSDFIGVLTPNQTLILLQYFRQYDCQNLEKSSSAETYLSCLLKKSQTASSKRKKDILYNQNKRRPTPLFIQSPYSDESGNIST